MNKKTRVIEINRAIYELENQIKSLKKEKTMIERENIKLGSRLRIIWGGGEDSDKISKSNVNPK